MRFLCLLIVFCFIFSQSFGQPYTTPIASKLYHIQSPHQFFQHNHHGFYREGEYAEKGPFYKGWFYCFNKDSLIRWNNDLSEIIYQSNSISKLKIMDNFIYVFFYSDLKVARINLDAEEINLEYFYLDRRPLDCVHINKQIWFLLEEACLDATYLVCFNNSLEKIGQDLFVRKESPCDEQKNALCVYQNMLIILLSSKLLFVDISSKEIFCEIMLGRNFVSEIQIDHYFLYCMRSIKKNLNLQTIELLHESNGADSEASEMEDNESDDEDSPEEGEALIQNSNYKQLSLAEHEFQSEIDATFIDVIDLRNFNIVSRLYFPVCGLNLSIDREIVLSCPGETILAPKLLKPCEIIKNKGESIGFYFKLFDLRKLPTLNDSILETIKSEIDFELQFYEEKLIPPNIIDYLAQREITGKMDKSFYSIWVSAIVVSKFFNALHTNNDALAGRYLSYILQVCGEEADVLFLLNADITNEDRENRFHHLEGGVLKNFVLKLKTIF